MAEREAYGVGGRLLAETLKGVVEDAGSLRARFSSNTRMALELAFPSTEVRNFRVPGLEVVFSEVSVVGVIRRLNDTFGSNWSFRIIKYEFVPPSNPVQVVVHGRLVVSVMTSGAASMEGMRASQGSDECVKDGIGCSSLTADPNGNLINIGWDIKTAASDALKKAASLLGVGLDLYERAPSAPAAPGGQQQQQGPQQRGTFPAADPDQLAQPFQIDKVVQMFRNDFGVEPEVWCPFLGLRGPADLTQGMVTGLLTHQHPFIAEAKARSGRNPAPAMGINTSHA